MTEDVYRSAKTILHGAGFYFIGILSSKLLSYIYRLYIARYFGAENYGLFSLGLALVGIFLVIASLGLNISVVRFIPIYEIKKDYRRMKGIITFAILVTLMCSTVMAYLMYVLSDEISVFVFHNPRLEIVLKILAFSLPLTAISQVISQTFSGFKRVNYKVFIERILVNFLSVVLVISFGLLGFGIEGIALSYTLAALMTFLTAMTILEFKVYPLLRSKIRPTFEVKKTLTFSLPLVLAGVVSSIIQWTDTLMIGYFINAVEVGIYNVVLATVFLLSAISPALSILLLPVLSEFYAKGDLIGQAKISKSVTKWIFYFNFPIFLFIVFNSSKLLTLMFGMEYIMGEKALIILSFGYMLTSIIAVESTILILLKKTKTTMYITTVTGIINVILNYSLIPKFGINGAAMASSISLIFSWLMNVVACWHYSRILSLSRFLLKSSVSGIIAFGIVLLPIKVFVSELHPILFLLSLGIYSVIYVIGLLVFKGFDDTDIEILRSVENRSGIRIGFVRNFVKRFK